MDMDALLYLKWITNKDLLYRACHTAAWMGGSRGAWMHVYVCLSPFGVHRKLS